VHACEAVRDGGRLVGNIKDRATYLNKLLNTWCAASGHRRDNSLTSSAIGKRVVDFLLVLIELFFARCYGWGATGEYRLKIGDFLQRGSVDRKFHVEGVVPHQRCFFSENLDKWSFVSYKNIAANFNRLSRVHERYRRQTDRQTDGRTTTYSEREREFANGGVNTEVHGSAYSKVNRNETAATREKLKYDLLKVQWFKVRSKTD